MSETFRINFRYCCKLINSSQSSTLYVTLPSPKGNFRYSLGFLKVNGSWNNSGWWKLTTGHTGLGRSEGFRLVMINEDCDSIYVHDVLVPNEKE